MDDGVRLAGARARLASRVDDAVSVSTSSVPRATYGSMISASAKAPAQPLWPFPTTISANTKTPRMIDGMPVKTSSITRSGTAIAGFANSLR